MVTLTNENEFNSFVNNKKNEALKDRMILVRVPYNLRVADEVRIYEKLLGDSGLKGVHIAPHTLRVASMFAILTRLEPSKKSGLSLMKKLKLYDNQSVEGFSNKDVKELQEEAQREGMVGISPECMPNLHPFYTRSWQICLGTNQALYSAAMPILSCLDIRLRLLAHRHTLVLFGAATTREGNQWRSVPIPSWLRTPMRPTRIPPR